MSARDLYHANIKNALIKDGWTITDDPLRLRWAQGEKDMYVDLGADKLLTAEKAKRKIAVEVKSFVGRSQIRDLQQAVGQYILYLDVLSQVEPDRELYLAIHEEVFDDLFEEPIGQLLLEKQRLKLIVFNRHAEVILEWLPK